MQELRLIPQKLTNNNTAESKIALLAVFLLFIKQKGCVMLCINVCEYSGDISDAVFFRLKEYFEVLYLRKHTLKKAGRGEKILLISTGQIINTDIPAINIFSPDFNICPSDKACGVSIVWSQSKNQLEALAKSNAQVITCGMSEKDTFTCTSIDDLRVVIAMQRTISDVFGAKHLPFETPVEIKNPDDIYIEMAIAALKTLLQCQTDT